MEVNQVKTDRDLSIEHQNVPVAHEGLHNFLYSSDEEHSAVAAIAAWENDGTQIMAIDVWRDLATNAKVAGVYAVIDNSHQTQYIGYSRNILLSIERSHRPKWQRKLCIPAGANFQISEAGRNGKFARFLDCSTRQHSPWKRR
jgi:hypothetical protein